MVTRRQSILKILKILKKKINVKDTPRCLKSGQNINKLLTWQVSGQVLHMLCLYKISFQKSKTLRLNESEYIVLQMRYHQSVKLQE